MNYRLNLPVECILPHIATKNFWPLRRADQLRQQLSLGNVFFGFGPFFLYMFSRCLDMTEAHAVWLLIPQRRAKSTLRRPTAMNGARGSTTSGKSKRPRTSRLVAA